MRSSARMRVTSTGWVIKGSPLLRRCPECASKASDSASRTCPTGRPSKKGGGGGARVWRRARGGGLGALVGAGRQADAGHGQLRLPGCLPILPNGVGRGARRACTAAPQRTAAPSGAGQHPAAHRGGLVCRQVAQQGQQPSLPQVLLGHLPLPQPLVELRERMSRQAGMAGMQSLEMVVRGGGCSAPSLHLALPARQTTDQPRAAASSHRVVSCLQRLAGGQPGPPPGASPAAPPLPSSACRCRQHLQPQLAVWTGLRASNLPV